MNTRAAQKPPDVAVVGGGGIAGTAIAWGLARAGAHATLSDAEMEVFASTVHRMPNQQGMVRAAVTRRI